MKAIPLAFGIVDFFQWLMDIIMSLINLVISLFKGLIQLISLIGPAVQSLTLSIGFLPSFLVAFATATITISVIFIIVGRNSGGKN